MRSALCPYVFCLLYSLLYTDFPYLSEISIAQQSLPNPILHEGSHAVFYGLESQLLHFRTVLDQHFHLIRPGD